MREYICGKNSVLDAIKSGIPIDTVYLVTKQSKETIEGPFNIKVISKQEMDKMTNLNHQGFLASLKEFNYWNISEIAKDRPEKVLILDHVQDPHNFGAILRSANASGVKHIIIPKDRAVKVTPTVLKVASGGQAGIKIIRVDSLFSEVKKMKEMGFWIYSTTLDNESVSYKHASINYPMALVVGNEATGVSKPILKISDQKLHIDMQGTVQSLNVSVATGILLFMI